MLEGFQDVGRALPHPNTPRNVGLFLTAMGTITMAMGIFECLHVRAELTELRAVPLMRPSFLMGLLMSMAGVALFFGIIARIL